jgi:hypothetical protein
VPNTELISLVVVMPFIESVVLLPALTAVAPMGEDKPLPLI